MSIVNKKISELPNVDMMALTGAEEFEIIQGGINKKMDLETWYTILSGGGGGGLPGGGTAHTTLRLGSDGVTPEWGYNIEDIMGMTAFDVGFRILNDCNNNPAFEFHDNATRSLFDGVARLSLDLVARQGFDQYGVMSLDYNSRVLWDDAGYRTFDFANGAKGIYDDAGDLVFDISNRQMRDASAGVSIDSNYRRLFDAAGVVVIDYNNRTMADTSGFTVYDFLNRILNDNAGTQAIDHNLRLLNLHSGAQAVDWSTGFKVSNVPWAFSGRTATNTETGWHVPTTYTNTKTFLDSSAVTVEVLANVVGSIINALLAKGLLAN